MNFPRPSCASTIIFTARSAAEDLKALAYSDAWLALGHYHHTYRGYRSYAGSKNFFFSPEGQSDPYKELTATVAAFSGSIETGNAHPICRFPARFQFLKEHVPEVRALPGQKCSEFEEWYANINPDGITLIFPSSFLNNPASAFGHSLIRIDQPKQSKDSEILSYSANFSAETHGENALVYAFKGLLGGYSGYFTLLPYYQLVKLYSDLESRDIYEYSLNFSAAETAQVVRHLWELRNTAFTYYYFDENCSFHLLGLLDAARPSLKLRQKFKLWALPADTLKAITAEPGMVKERHFRPSLTSRLNARLQSMQAADVSNAKKIALKERGPDSAGAAALELAYDYREYLTLRGGAEDNAYGLELLKARSRLQDKAPERSFHPEYPEEGHGSQRLMLGSTLADGRYATRLSYRGVYHYLDDPGQGFAAGAGIELVEPTLQLKDTALSLHEVKFIGIASLAPRNELVHPISWKLNTGLKRLDADDTRQKLGSQSELLFGFSEFSEKGSYLYLLGGAAINLISQYDKDYSLGPAVNPGVSIALNEDLAAGADLIFSRGLAGEVHTEISFNSNLTWRLSNNLAAEINFLREKTFSDYKSEIEARIKFYF